MIQLLAIVVAQQKILPTITGNLGTTPAITGLLTNSLLKSSNRSFLCGAGFLPSPSHFEPNRVNCLAHADARRDRNMVARHGYDQSDFPAIIGRRPPR
ncbi:hypothetical protein MXD61_05415 [Frankia sp. AgPm24]|uniref:hypothetical protein n=1 Tax=Frankia sp. AgPm24 TaxID=631128 RepID=UPI00200F3F49|nr:hypothetical protein [Frankia sp. AgPm24]MCK9921340.1 hypothetical protein [Frankia sp. AgPm24]